MGDTAFTWIDALGSVTELNDLGMTWAVKGGRNFYNLPFSINAYEVPLKPGETFSSIDLGPRVLDYPMLVTARSRHEFISKMRTLVSALNPDKGEGTLRVTHEGNAARQIRCRYVGGLEGAGDARGWSAGSARVVLSFRASDPFWYSPAAKKSQFVWGAPTNFFPFFPLSLNASPTFDSTLVNEGDHVAWPVWTIQGPGTTLILTNETTGYSLQANLSLLSGEIVVINTKPGVKTVKDLDGVNYFSTLTADSVLWGLARGSNDVHIEFAGSDATSLISVEYNPPFLSM